MNHESHPASNSALHQEAERAALAAYLAAKSAKPSVRMKLMDRAAEQVFRKAGNPKDVAEFFAFAVTALVMDRDVHGD